MKAAPQKTQILFLAIVFIGIHGTTPAQAEPLSGTNDINLSALLDAISLAFANFFRWFFSQSATFQLQSLGGLTAAASIASNFRAIGGVWTSMTKCERLLNFTGLGIGRSDDFQAPVRALLLSFVLYSAYQILSHLTGSIVEPSWSAYLLDAGVQLFLMLLLGLQFLRIWAMARDRWEGDTEQLRFWRTFNSALKGKRINIRSVAVSTGLLPVAAIVPKLAKLGVLSDQHQLAAIAYRLIQLVR